MVKGDEMSDSVKTMSSDQVKGLIANAETLGMAPADVAEVLSKYGPDVLTVVTTGLKNGFSVAFIMECVKLFGPMVLDALTSLYNKSKQLVISQGFNGKVTDAVVAEVISNKPVESIPPVILNILLEKLVPWALEKYGQQILSAMIEAILSAVKNEGETTNVK
jgi:hypothetical protein